MIIEPGIWLAYTLACVAIIIIPGPSVTVIIANSLRYGSRAGLMNVAGTQAGLLILVGILAFGLSAVVTIMGEAFFWLKLAGAAYLIWLGIKLLRSDGTLGVAEAEDRAGQSFFWQGFLVILSNPKALLFFGAFIPQFVNPSQSAIAQTLLLGLTFMVVATILDGAYALLAGRTGVLLKKKYVRKLELASGTALIGGGIWLALTRRV